MGAPASMELTIGRTPTLRHRRRSQEVCLGPVESIPPGQGRAYRIGEESVAVFRPRTGGFYAVENACPHRGAPLAEGLIGDGTVICPFHAWKFDLATGTCRNDPTRLRTYAVREEHGVLYLELA